MAADATTPLQPPPAPDVVAEVVHVRVPRPGELTSYWQIVTAVTWLAAVAAMVAVWRVSDQLGLSTWWLGPRGEPNARVLQVLPFVPGIVMVLAAINHVRYVAWWGMLAAALIVATGVADLGHVFRLGLLEVLIGAAAAAVSLASLTGTYRRRAG